MLRVGMGARGAAPPTRPPWLRPCVRQWSATSPWSRRPLRSARCPGPACSTSCAAHGTGTRTQGRWRLRGRSVIQAATPAPPGAAPMASSCSRVQVPHDMLACLDAVVSWLQEHNSWPVKTVKTGSERGPSSELFIASHGLIRCTAWGFYVHVFLEYGLQT